jgi:predicted enzyme related to lactoylglutathione lyase
MIVERTDVVSVFTQDIQRGQVTLDVFDPSGVGQAFAPSPPGLALRVPDVDAARAELETRGVESDGETIETGVCRMASFKDPDGNALLLHRRFDA